MAGHFHFRQYLDAACIAVGHQILELLLGVHAFIGQQGVPLVGRGGGADGPDGTELVVARNGQAPALVFRQVQVQDVVLVVVHGVHKIVEFLHRVVIAAHIHHHAAPAEVRRILDAAARQPGRSIRELVLKLEEGCHGHGFSIGRGVAQLHAAGRKLHGVAFTAKPRNFLFVQDFEVLGSAGGGRHLDGLRNDVIGVGPCPAKGAEERCRK